MTTARGGASQATPGVTVADSYTSAVASLLGPPTFPFLGTDQKYHVVYDLELQNAGTVPATLHRVEVLDAADPVRVLVAYEGDALVRRLRTLAGDRGIVQNAEIEPSAGRIFYVELAFDSLDQAPQGVLHRLSALGAANPAAREATPIDYTIRPHNIAAGEPLVLGPPVAGKGFAALKLLQHTLETAALGSSRPRVAGIPPLAQPGFLCLAAQEKQARQLAGAELIGAEAVVGLVAVAGASPVLGAPTGSGRATRIWPGLG